MFMFYLMVIVFASFSASFEIVIFLYSLTHPFRYKIRTMPQPGRQKIRMFGTFIGKKGQKSESQGVQYCLCLKIIAVTASIAPALCYVLATHEVQQIYFLVGGIWSMQERMNVLYQKVILVEDWLFNGRFLSRKVIQRFSISFLALQPRKLQLVQVDFQGQIPNGCNLMIFFVISFRIYN